MSDSRAFTCDAAIVGGGPAGAAAAIGLARRGARVLLLEREAAPRFKPGEVVEPTIRAAFAELGVDERFEALGSLAAIGNVSSWGSERPQEADAILNPHGCGYFVDRSRLETWLLEEACLAGARVEQGAREVEARLATSIGRMPLSGLDRRGCRSLSLITWVSEGRPNEARAPLVVDATGRARGVTPERGRQRFDDLVGLIAYVDEDGGQCKGERLHACDCRIYIEAVRDGWWYSAPLPDRRCVVAFMTDADLIPVGDSNRLAWFRQQLAATRLTARRILRDRDPHPYALRICAAMSTRRHTVSGAGWVAIGDAAATYDPLAGRGVAAAVAKGVALARLIAAHGDSTAGLARVTSEYAEAEHAAYDDYLAVHRAIYRRERRWSDEVFWRRRH